jgi:hypothetical protein
VSIRLRAHFIIRGDKPDDLKDYLAARTSVEHSGLTLDDLVSEAGELHKYGMNTQNLVVFNDWMRKNNLDYSRLISIMKEIEELEKQGLSPDIIEKLVKATESFGGINLVLVAIKEYGNLKRISDEKYKLRSKLSKEIDDLNRKRNNLEEEINNTKNMVKVLHAQNLQYVGFTNIVKDLVENHSFDPLLFHVVKAQVSKHGDPLIVMEALNKYAKIEEMENKITELDKELFKKKEIAKNIEEVCIKNLTAFEVNTRLIYRLFKEFGVLLEKYNRHVFLQNIDILISDPAKLKITPIEFYRIGIVLIRSLIGFSVINREKLEYHDEIEDLLLKIEKEMDEVFRIHSVEARKYAENSVGHK